MKFVFSILIILAPITFSLMLTVCNAIAFLIVVFLIPKDNARDEGCVERHVIEDDERREVV